MYLHVIREEALFVQDSDVSMRSARCIFTRRSKFEQFRLAAGEPEGKLKLASMSVNLASSHCTGQKIVLVII